MTSYACQALGARPDQVETNFRRDHTLPALTLEHQRWLQDLDRPLAESGLMLVGNYLNGMSIEDCAGRAMAEFERMLGG